jgi:hypothetical protein
MRDEGRPFGVGFQKQASNHFKRLRPKAVVVSIEGNLGDKLGRWGAERRTKVNH